ncbi:MAG TPA: type II secretion system ATPase GspE [Phycisphaerae bacterium]|nr:type II secretion system ATPase GspE [Phycisphaerae bacterium]HOB74158.1 type II secretion system ATPase GspE [Phycisphaerae bacterium]HOJ55918.1 type II secretion system ATPase GspE [Phycisphaerae bacterium]HOL27616.1 type II secretion system ATPase GspE [Phycisphaerae bacterium]HPP22182.1 type II secretion system ATPase GspE [Phycisphaerae bacterium]
MSVGEILLERGKIKPEHLQAALAAKKSSNERIDRILVRMGLVDEKDVLEIWGEQMSIDVIDLSQVQIDPELFKLMPQRLIHKKGLLPVDRVNGTLRVASADPYDISAFDELRMVTGLRIEPVLASESEIQRLIRQHFGVGSSTVDEMTEEESDSGSVELLSDSVDENGDPIELAQEATVVKLVNEILQEALRDKASDIHIEPYEDDLKIRYRIDGVLQQTPVPPQIRRFQAAIISRIKIMSNLNIAEKRLPQDGGFKARIHGREVDFRVSVIPTGFGEAVVLRILDRQSINLSLQQLGMDNEVLENFQALINRPHGIVLVTGPTGSGKTTTLYAALHTIVSDEIKILTIEDPIEYYLPGINQVQVSEKIGLDFARALRAFLRHDPDVILVGEIRDRETAEVAINASLTGHLVFSTLHTNDSCTANTRLLDMGVEPFLVSSSLDGVLAQRLVRKICPHCKEAYEPDLAALPKDLVLEPGQLLYRGRGCRECRNIGYRGRLGIFELLMIDDELREMIVQRASAGRIQQVALKHGLKLLREDGWGKVRAGLTTPEEVLRATKV